MNGWVKIHRKIIEKGYYKRSQYVHLWIHLLLTANHESKEFMWNNQIIVIKEGQMVTGRKQLSEDTGIPESTIEDILNFLETQQQIQQEKTTKYRLITIVNWESHQENSSKATTKQQQSNTNKTLKKEKKDTIPNKQGLFENNLIPEIIKAFEVVNPACKRMYGNKTQRQACQDLLDTYGFEEVSKVVAFLPKSNKIAYMPTITTPLQLWEKYQALKDKLQQKKSEFINKNTPNFVL